MSESVRKRKSLWDMKEETQLPAEISVNTACHERESYSSLHGGHGPKLSDLEGNNALKSKNCSLWPSLEPSDVSNIQKDESTSRNLNEIPETTKAWGGDKSYSISTGFNEWEQQNHSRSPENSWSQSRRYRRSRSRGRGRSRSRSRSRSWSRSPIPLRDYRRESYGWSDRRRSGSGVSSRPCRDFAVGKCRRGSQCRFLHQDNNNHSDGSRSEGDQAERWRSRQEHGEALKYVINEGPRDNPRNNVSDGYADKDESLRNSSKSTTCNDFLKGKCHRGSSCRYAHHSAFGENFNRSNRNAPFDHDHKRHPHKNSIPCKYYAMGKCNRDDCRFSHDGASCGDLKGMLRDDRYGHNVDEEKKSWNGPKWGEATGVADIAKSTGWGDSNVGNVSYADPTTAEKRTDDIGDRDLDNKSKSWNGPKWGDATGVSDSDVAKPTGWGNNNVENMNFAEPTAEKLTDNKRGHNLDNKKKSWNGPIWGDATGVSDVAKSTGWGNSNVENMTFAEPTTADKRTDERWGHSSDNQSRIWGSAKWEDKADQTDDSLFAHLGNGSNGVNMGITNSTGVAKSFDREELSLIPQGSHSQTLDGNSTYVHEQNMTQGASGQQLTTRVMHPMVSENSNIQQYHCKRGDNITTDDSIAVNGISISGNAMHPVLVPGQSFNQKGDRLGSLPPSFSGISQSQHMTSLNTSNGHNNDPNGSLQQIFSPLNPQNRAQIHHEESGKSLEMPEFRVPQANSGIPQSVATSELVAQKGNLPLSLTQIFGNGQLPQLYAALNPPNSTGFVLSLPNSASSAPPVASIDQLNLATRSQEQYYPIGDSIGPSKPGNSNEPHEQKNAMPLERLSPSCTGGPDSGKLQKSGSLEVECHENLKLKQQKPIANSEVEENNKIIAEKCKQEQENIHSGNVDADGRVAEGNSGKEEKEMRLFKVALVEFVKEILKPTWKEGQMSREVHKTIVKKVVDKVTSTTQGIHIPKTQDKIDQYLSYSKPKLTKLVQAYIERFLKS
uniref:Putative zinc finger CCCH domain-containing protein 55 n=1 Tax=Davidia involucrata TaxID=16924 RepID=A0A5B7CBI3_DAVIN